MRKFFQTYNNAISGKRSRDLEYLWVWFHFNLRISVEFLHNQLQKNSEVMKLLRSTYELNDISMYLYLLGFYFIPFQLKNLLGVSSLSLTLE